MGLWSLIRGKQKEEGGIIDSEIKETPTKAPDLGLPINAPSLPSLEKRDDITIKIDTLSAKLDQISQRLANIERALMELQKAKQPPVQPMQATQPAQPQLKRQWYPR